MEYCPALNFFCEMELIDVTFNKQETKTIRAGEKVLYKEQKILPTVMKVAEAVYSSQKFVSTP